MKIHKTKSRKKFIILPLLLAVVALSGYLLISKQSPKNANSSTAKTTSSVVSAQSDFTSDDTTKLADNASRGDAATGIIADTNGTSAVPTDTANATSSANGKITVNSPTKNSLLTDGATVSGTSSLSKVSYRIVDTEVGMISTGSLNVVNGKFSGTIKFQTTAQNGKLDFFGTESDGDEFDNISIPVRFR